MKGIQIRLIFAVCMRCYLTNISRLGIILVASIVSYDGPYNSPTNDFFLLDRISATNLALLEKRVAQQLAR